MSVEIVWAGVQHLVSTCGYRRTGCFEKECTLPVVGTNNRGEKDDGSKECCGNLGGSSCGRPSGSSEENKAGAAPRGGFGPAWWPTASLAAFVKLPPPRQHGALSRPPPPLLIELAGYLREMSRARLPSHSASLSALEIVQALGQVELS